MSDKISKNIMITGASSGFGKLFAETLAKEGYRIFATMREVEGKNADEASRLHDWARGEGVSIDVLELDVTDDASVESAVARILASAGCIDVLINNAGVGATGILEAFSPDQVRELFEVNVFGPLRVNRAVLPGMRRRRSGLLIHITSTAGRLFLPFLSTYNASKSALEALAESSRYELGALGIDSVIVEPGAYLTEIQQKSQTPVDAERTAEYGAVARIPEKLFGEMGKVLTGPQAPDPQEVADAVQRLIETPAGQRPLRTVVGSVAVEGARAFNRAAERTQERFLETMGLPR